MRPIAMTARHPTPMTPASARSLHRPHYRIRRREFAKRIATESDRPGLATIKDALGLPGGLPIKVGNETIGGVGVAGAPGGNGDVACAEAAIEAIKEQLK